MLSILSTTASKIIRSTRGSTTVKLNIDSGYNTLTIMIGCNQSAQLEVTEQTLEMIEEVLAARK